MTSPAPHSSDLGGQTMDQMGRHRYALVLGLIVVNVLYSVLAPDGAGPRFVQVTVQSIVLIIVIVTSGYGVNARRWSVGAVLAVGTISFVAAALEGDPPWLLSGVSSILIVLTIIELTRGMVRLLSNAGVTLQAIAGGLAIYLLIGSLFAVVISVLAALPPHPYFTQGMNGDTSDHVYFSFTSMTTTGYGDFTPATRPGKALAVFEMLVGQIYLVTVISLLVSRAPARARA